MCVCVCVCVCVRACARALADKEEGGEKQIWENLSVNYSLSPERMKS